METYTEFCAVFADDIQVGDRIRWYAARPAAPFGRELCTGVVLRRVDGASIAMIVETDDGAVHNYMDRIEPVWIARPIGQVLQDDL